MSIRTSGHSQMRPRLAAWAAASLALHALLLLLFQFAGDRDAAPRAEPVPVRLVELAPAPAAPESPEPEPPMPQEIPDPSPQEIPQQPDTEPERPPEPGIPEAPRPEPEIPNKPAEQPDAPAPGPAPEPTPDTPPQGAQQGAQMIAPEDAPGGTTPGLAYDGGAATPLGRFGRAVQCAGIDVRYDASCADIGPIYLAGDVAPLAPDIVEKWRAQDAAMAEAVRMRNSADRQAVVPCGFSVCIPGPERFEARGQGVRAGLRELNLIE
jgi:hypothetical protein